MATKAIFIKCVIQGNEEKFYVGVEPSDASADPCHRLGQYFIILHSIESARIIAGHEAKRIGVPVIECAPLMFCAPLSEKRVQLEGRE